MFFVLNDEPSLKKKAVLEVTICEILLYVVTIAAVIAALFKMQDLKYSKQHSEYLNMRELSQSYNLQFLFFRIWNWIRLHAIAVGSSRSVHLLFIQYYGMFFCTF